MGRIDHRGRNAIVEFADFRRLLSVLLTDTQPGPARDEQFVVLPDWPFTTDDRNFIFAGRPNPAASIHQYAGVEAGANKVGYGRDHCKEPGYAARRRKWTRTYPEGFRRFEQRGFPTQAGLCDRGQ